MGTNNRFLFEIRKYNGTFLNYFFFEKITVFF